LDPAQPKRPPYGKILVLVALVGAAAFGGYLGYLAYSNDSFPSLQEPFDNYASITSAVFNGTEYAFTITWSSANYLPLYAQMTSTASDNANSPVCSLGLANVTAGESIFLPFGVSGGASIPVTIDLWIAVKPLTGAEFTLQQQVSNFTTRAGDILPVQEACNEPPGVE